MIQDTIVSPIMQTDCKSKLYMIYWLVLLSVTLNGS